MASRPILLILIASVLSGGGCKQKTANADEAPRHGTPREAFLTLLRAMRDADGPKIIAACRVTDEQRSIIEAGAEYTRAVYAFRDDMIKAYGRDAWETFQDRTHSPGNHDSTFVLITDKELEKADKMEIEQDEKSATCSMPTGTGRVRLIKTDKGIWLADGSTFVPAGQSVPEMRKMLDSLTAIVRKYQKAVGKPNITASDIDYELGREIDFLISKIPDKAPHRFEIDKL